MFEALKGNIPDSVYNDLATANFFGINTPLRVSHFLAQCSHESEDFKVTTENLNYSASGLIATWPHLFTDTAIATKYAHNPEMIANYVYGRPGNYLGNTEPGDGWKFIGRGYIQITGRGNYTAFNKHVKDDNVVENPELVASKYALMSSAWFFGEHGCNEKADGGSSVENIVAVTKIINTALLGLQDRIYRFEKYWSLLNPENA